MTIIDVIVNIYKYIHEENTRKRVWNISCFNLQIMTTENMACLHVFKWQAFTTPFQYVDSNFRGFFAVAAVLLIPFCLILISFASASPCARVTNATYNMHPSTLVCTISCRSLSSRAVPALL